MTSPTSLAKAHVAQQKVMREYILRTRPGGVKGFDHDALCDLLGVDDPSRVIFEQGRGRAAVVRVFPVNPLATMRAITLPDLAMDEHGRIRIGSYYDGEPLRMRVHDPITWDQLAPLTGYSATTLRRAASGSTTPKPAVTLAIAQACGGTADDAATYWKHARRAERRVSQPRSARRRPAPLPEYISTKDQLADALVDLYEKAGSPPVRMMEERGGPHQLPRSTVHRIVTYQALPADPAQLTAYLTACEVPPAAPRRVGRRRAPRPRARIRSGSRCHAGHDSGPAVGAARSSPDRLHASRRDPRDAESRPGVRPDEASRAPGRDPP